MQIKKIVQTLLVLLLGAIFVWCMGFVFFIHHINSYPVNQSKTDAIVVLTGGRNRIAEAIKLLNGRVGEKMFISGVSQKISLSEIEKKAGIKAFERNKIELGYEATDTISNASEIKKWVEKNNIRSLHLVTSNYHLPRALEELSVYNLPIDITAHPVYSEKIAKKWWSSLSTFKLLASEYNKFLYTYINHRRQQLMEK